MLVVLNADSCLVQRQDVVRRTERPDDAVLPLLGWILVDFVCVLRAIANGAR